MSLYNNILFPFDEREGTEDAIQFVVKLAKTHKSKLILLYTHRLDNKDGFSRSASELKKVMQSSVAQKIDQLKKDYQLEEGLEYEFHTELGFLSSRILIKMQEYPVDLLVIDRNVFNELNGAADQITCPIMITPD